MTPYIEKEIMQDTIQRLVKENADLESDLDAAIRHNIELQQENAELREKSYALRQRIDNGIRCFVFKDTTKIENIDIESIGFKYGSNATLILDEGVNLE